MQRKDATALECMVDVQKGSFCGVMRQPGAPKRTGLRHNQTRLRQFQQHAPDHDWIGIYALCNLFGFKGFFA